MLAQLFGVRSAQLREKLWQHYPASQTLCWQLQRCGEAAPSDLVVIDRIKRLAELVEPKYLLKAAENLVEPGRSRPDALIQFEETILKIIDKDGHWLWTWPERKERDDPRRATPTHGAA
jgi:hypothetical protein